MRPTAEPGRPDQSATSRSLLDIKAEYEVSQQFDDMLNEAERQPHAVASQIIAMVGEAKRIAKVLSKSRGLFEYDWDQRNAVKAMYAACGDLWKAMKLIQQQK